MNWTALGMIPYYCKSLILVESVPMVYVFPDPVYPYEKIQTLLPSKNDFTKCCTSS